MTQQGSVDFSEVRKKVPLTWFFEHVLGATPKPTNGTIRYGVCPDCGASQNQHSVRVSVKDDHFRCFACPAKGDVIDAASMAWGKEPREAALELMGAGNEIVNNYVPTKPLPVHERDESALRMAIDILSKEARTLDPAVIAYLEERRIPAALCREACKRGVMASLPAVPAQAKEFLFDVLGEELLLKSGLLKPQKKAPAIAFRPLIFFAYGKTSAEFRVITPVKEGDQKVIRYGSIAPGAWQGSDDILMTEGYIDMLSSIVLGYTESIIVLPGCENWRPEWFHKLKGRRVLLALDNDGPGLAANEKLKPVLDAQGAIVSLYPHREGIKDLNNELCSRFAA